MILNHSRLDIQDSFHNPISHRFPSMRILCISIFFCFQTSVLALYAQDPEAAIVVKPDTATIGDNIFYTLTVTRPAVLRLAYPTQEDTATFAPFELRAVKKLTEEAQGNLILEKYQFTLAAYDTGEVTLAPKSIPYRNISSGDTTEKFLQLEARRIVVLSVLDTSQKDIVDIKPVQSVAVPMWVYLAIIGVLVGLVGGGFLLYRYWKNRPKTVAPIKVIPTKPAYLVALDRLAALEKYPLETQLDFKKYYSEMSDIVRDFIESHYGIEVKEQTTSEIFDNLNRRIKTGEAERLKEVLEKSDLVKFAKFFPTQSESKESYLKAKQIFIDAAPQAAPGRRLK
jgi:hypothetical protein